MTALTLRLRHGWARLPAGERGMLLLILLWTLLLPLANPRVAATDEIQFYVYLRSLRFDGDLDFANDYQRFHEINPRAGVDASLLQPNRIRPATGLYGNVAPIGAAIMWAPFFLLADGLVHLANAFGAGIPADGFSPPYIYAICYASALYGLLGLLLCYRLARRYASPFAATLACATIWLATPLVWYMFIQMAFAHAAAFFLVALFLTIWLRHRPPTTDRRPPTTASLSSILYPLSSVPLHPFTPSPLHPLSSSTEGWVALGVVGGLMTMTREQYGLFLMIPAIDALARYGRLAWVRAPLAAFGALLARHALFLAVFLLVLAPQLVVYQVLNGSPRPAGEVSGRINWCSPHMMDTLIDYDPRPSARCQVVGDLTERYPERFPPFAHGALVWSPVLIPALLGLALLWRGPPGGRPERLLAATLALAFLGQTYINGAYGATWHLSGAFGFRRLIECTPIFIIGLALLADRAAARIDRRWLVVPALLFVAWNAGLVLNASFFNDQTNLRQGMIWPDLWRWQLDLPRNVINRAGELLFDRCRFLKNGC